jgi:hypothetical protein
MWPHFTVLLEGHIRKVWLYLKLEAPPEPEQLTWLFMYWLYSVKFVVFETTTSCFSLDQA